MPLRASCSPVRCDHRAGDKFTNHGIRKSSAERGLKHFNYVRVSRATVAATTPRVRLVIALISGVLVRCSLLLSGHHAPHQQGLHHPPRPGLVLSALPVLLLTLQEVAFETTAL